MRKIEKAIIGFILGAVPIISCFLIGWWTSMPFVPESRVFLFALTGIFVGVTIDILFLKKWIKTAYSMKPIVWMMIYLFYSIGMFGFFMGVPVFNVMLGLPAGFLIGGWLVYTGADSTNMKKIAQRSALFTTSVLTFICASSAAIALLNSSTASELQSLSGIPITQGTLIGIILCGGIFMLILQWWLTLKSVELTYRYFAVHTN